MMMVPPHLISTTEHVMTPLRRRMIDDMKLKNLSPRTIDAYVSRVGSFARHFGRSPQDLGRDDVRAYLLHLVQEKKVSWSVYNQNRPSSGKRSPTPPTPSGSSTPSLPSADPNRCSNTWPATLTASPSATTA
jgi:hypothetical protein